MRRLWLAIALALSAVGSAYAQPIGNDGSRPVATDKSGSEPQRPSEPNNVGLAGAIKPDAADPNSCDSKNQHTRECRDLQAQEDMAYWAKLMFCATVAGSLVGLVGIYLVFKTLKETRVSAKAAVRSAQVAEETAERQLRAYVGLDKAKIVRSQDRVMRCVVEIKNFGQTPAYKVSPLVNIRGANKADLIAFEQTEQIVSDGLTIGPGTFVTLEGLLGEVMTQEREDAVRGGHSIVYVYGSVEYFDAFDKRRTTTFRLYLRESVFGDGKLKNCAEGNNAT